MDFAALADKLYLPSEFLETINALLKEKKQVIFQGPPGTGKTYVAQELAQHVAGSKQRVTLVQFHPSYAYEDFVQGYRPELIDGQPGFKLKDGPLRRAAETSCVRTQRRSFPRNRRNQPRQLGQGVRRAVLLVRVSRLGDIATAQPSVLMFRIRVLAFVYTGL